MVAGHRSPAVDRSLNSTMRVEGRLATCMRAIDEFSALSSRKSKIDQKKLIAHKEAYLLLIQECSEDYLDFSNTYSTRYDGGWISAILHRLFSAWDIQEIQVYLQSLAGRGL